MTSSDVGETLIYALVLTFKITNNEAEYKEPLLRLPAGGKPGQGRVHQKMGKYEIYFKDVTTLAYSFRDFQRDHSHRIQLRSRHIKQVCWQATPLQVHFVESIHGGVAQEYANVNKMIESVELPKDEVEAKRKKRFTPSNIIINGLLQNNLFSAHYLRCIAQPEITTILREIHKVYEASHS